MRTRSDRSEVQAVTRCFPPKAACDILVEEYESSMHWFTWSFDMPPWLQRYQVFMANEVHPATMSSGTALSPGAGDSYSFSVLILAVLALGAGFIRHKHENLALIQQVMAAGGDERTPDMLWRDLSETLESRYLSVVGGGGITSLQTAMLLSNHFVYKGQPNISFVVVGAMTKLAQSLGLHREASHDQFLEDGEGYLGWENEPNSRRIIWSSVRVYDTFSAMVCGTPFSIHHEHCDISHPRDTSPPVQIKCPLDRIFSMPSQMSSSFSPEQIHNLWTSNGLNPNEPPTLFHYQLKKYALYIHVHKALSEIYYGKGRRDIHGPPFGVAKTDLRRLLTTIRDIDVALQEWEMTLPQTLRLHDENYRPETFGICDRDWRTLQAQAMTLEVAYNCALILVHRPLLHYRLGHECRSCCPDPFQYSAETCWNAALRISRLYERFPDVLLRLRETAACSYFVMQLMPTGVVLAMMAVSDFRAARSYEAKTAISRIIKIQTVLREETPMAETGGVLQRELLKAVMLEELDSLCDPVSRPDPEHGSSLAADSVMQPLPNGCSTATRAPETPAVNGQQGQASLVPGITPPDMHEHVGPSMQDIGSHETWGYGGPAMLQAQAWSGMFDIPGAVEDVQPVNNPGVDQVLFGIEQDWMATLNKAQF